jgi:hypothetical protein
MHWNAACVFMDLNNKQKRQTFLQTLAPATRNNVQKCLYKNEEKHLGALLFCHVPNDTPTLVLVFSDMAEQKVCQLELLMYTSGTVPRDLTDPLLNILQNRGYSPSVAPDAALLLPSALTATAASSAVNGIFTQWCRNK